MPLPLLNAVLLFLLSGQERTEETHKASKTKIIAQNKPAASRAAAAAARAAASAMGDLLCGACG